MELEVVRIVADWLANKTLAGAGVNPMLSSIPLDSGDTSPPPVAVFDATRDSWVARRMLPNDTSITLPAVAVFLLNAAQLDGEVAQYYRRRQVLGRDCLPLREIGHEDRDAMRALYQARDPAFAQAAPRAAERQPRACANNVHLYTCTGMTLDPTVADWQRSGAPWLATAVLCDYQVRDLAP
jgi:hypothetical protein